MAAVGGAKVLRRTPEGLKQMPIPLKQLLQAKAEDVPVEAGDILFVPSSKVKSALSASTLLTAASTATIYRVPF
jgi:polysaccharide export outer membrane protein